MNTKHLGVALILAIVAISFSYSNLSSAAKADCSVDPSHPSCKDDGGGSDTNVPFAVAVVKHSGIDASSTLYAPATADPTCLAQAPSIKSLWATFPRHDLCATLTTTIAASIADDVVIQVETDNKSGNVLSVTVTGQDMIGADGIVHQSDPVTNVASVEPKSDGSFVIHVHADNVTLWKCDSHLLRKKTTCTEDVGTFSLHDMVYTPDP